MIYRVLKRLATGPSRDRYIEPGSVICGNQFSVRAISILLGKGSLSPVSAPPLDAFYGWKLRAARFKKAGYDTIGVLEADDAELVEAIGSNVRSIRKWKAELRGFLGLSGGELRGCGCGKKPQAEVIREEPQPEAKIEPEEAIEKQEVDDGTDE